MVNGYIFSNQFYYYYSLNNNNNNNNTFLCFSLFVVIPYFMFNLILHVFICNTFCSYLSCFCHVRMMMYELCYINKLVIVYR